MNVSNVELVAYRHQAAEKDISRARGCAKIVRAYMRGKMVSFIEADASDDDVMLISSVEWRRKRRDTT